MIAPSTILQGDMLDLIKDIPNDSIDMICTDPPYGIAYKSNMGEEGYQKEEIANDKLSDWVKILPYWLRAMHRVLAPGGCLAMFTSGGGPVAALPIAWQATEEVFGQVKNVLVWDRCDPGLGWRYRPAWESIIIAYKGDQKTWNGASTQTNILRYPRIIPKAGEHPTPKPVSLMGRLVEDNTNEGELILDPFCGGGPTLEASELLKRRWIGFDLEPRYVRLSTERMRPYRVQPTMF